MGPVEILGALKGATEATKTVLAIKEIASSAEAKLALANLRESLAEAREAAASLKEENTKLRNEIAEAKIADSDISKFIRRGILFFDDNSKLYKCPTCIEKDKKIITLSPDRMNNTPSFRCNNCQSHFKNPDWNEPIMKSSYTRNVLGIV
jgi:DNA-directed RNA polymerase subunit RPC12/RpoP